MKLKLRYGIIVLFTLVLTLNIANLGHCWYNGTAYAPAHRRRCSTVALSQKVDPLVLYRQHFNLAEDPVYYHFYATHDYIAHFALDYLYESATTKYYWLKNPSKNCLYAYLLATEYPDTESWVPNVRLDCGKSSAALAFKISEHHDLAGLLSYSIKRALAGAGELTRRKVVDGQSVPDPWCESAAFYFGAVTHYIADAAHPSHGAGVDYGGFHNWLEKEVSRYTMMDHYKTNNFGNNFFTINLETIIGHSSLDLRGDLNAYQCVNWMALKTQDINYGQFICNFYVLHGDFRFDEVNRNDPEYEVFFDRIEELLNWAVYYCASALKFHIGYFDGVCPGCLEDEAGETKKVSGQLNIADFMARFLIVFLVIAGFTAIGWYFGKKVL